MTPLDTLGSILSFLTEHQSVIEFCHEVGGWKGFPSKGSGPPHGLGAGGTDILRRVLRGFNHLSFQIHFGLMS